MSLTGSLADFSLPEILEFIEKGKKTGWLTLHPEPVSQARSGSAYYIWTYQGRLIAAANRLDNRGLVKLINQCQWVSPRVVSKLAQLCPSDIPLGLHLKNQAILRTPQLKQLFFLQVLQPMGALLQFQKGQFIFDQNVPIPLGEMTGLSVAAATPTLLALAKDSKTLPLKRWKSNRTASTVAVQTAYSDKIQQLSTVKGIQDNELASVLA